MWLSRAVNAANIVDIAAKFVVNHGIDTATILPLSAGYFHCRRLACTLSVRLSSCGLVVERTSSVKCVGNKRHAAAQLSWYTARGPNDGDMRAVCAYPFGVSTAHTMSCD